MIDKFVYNEKFIKDNIGECYNCIDYQVVAKNKDWFIEANKFCKKFAKRNKLDLMPVIGTLSALSPQCSWKQNKIFLEAYYKNPG